MRKMSDLGVLLLCVTLSQTMRADEKRDAKIKAEMVTNYLLWQQAWKISDAARIISFESPDFTSKVGIGTVLTKPNADGELRERMQQLQKIYEAHMEIKKLSTEPNRVVIWSNLKLSYNENVDGKLYRVSSVVWQLHTWVEYDRVWMLKRSEDLGSEEIISSKQISR